VLIVGWRYFALVGGDSIGRLPRQPNRIATLVEADNLYVREHARRNETDGVKRWNSVSGYRSRLSRV